MIRVGTFDNFNIVVAGVKGIARAGVDADLRNADDQVAGRGRRPNTALLAEAASAYPEDFSWVIYRLRPEARWHDGKPVTPEDVIFSFEYLEAATARSTRSYYRHVVKAEKSGEREIKFTFDGPGNRELPPIVGQLPVLPKHWWEGTDARAASAT